MNPNIVTMVGGKFYAADVCKGDGDYSECAGVGDDSGGAGAAGDYDDSGVSVVLSESGWTGGPGTETDKSALGASKGRRESADGSSGNL